MIHERLEAVEFTGHKGTYRLSRAVLELYLAKNLIQNLFANVVTRHVRLEQVSSKLASGTAVEMKSLDNKWRAKSDGQCQFCTQGTPTKRHLQAGSN